MCSAVKSGVSHLSGVLKTAVSGFPDLRPAGKRLAWGPKRLKKLAGLGFGAGAERLSRRLGVRDVFQGRTWFSLNTGGHSISIRLIYSDEAPQKDALMAFMYWWLFLPVASGCADVHIWMLELAAGLEMTA